MNIKKGILEISKRVFYFIKYHATHFFCSLWTWLKGLLSGVYSALRHLWSALGPRWLRITVVTVLVIFLAYGQLLKLLKPNLTRENIYSLQYLNAGWTDEERQTYYYTPQGTELIGLEYDWFVNLELALSHEFLATESNLRGWGFIVAPGQQATSFNPGNLPVGLGRHVDPISGKERLDIGCATCHTGELHYKGVALRVDGGQAVQSIPNAKRGEFITTLGASVLETLYNPAKWNRFAERVAGDDKKKRKELRKQFKRFAKNLKGFTHGAGAAKYYPVEEGRGRTDAVGRIGNVVFGYDLDEPANYRVADAPASYPFLWDMWRFDWVQYTGFTNQAMARNVGESLGVLAPIKLVDEEGKLLKGKEFGETLVDINGMHCVEGLLRKLKPPAWPEKVLGEINIERAKRGKQLFADKCVHCHGPHPTEPYQWQVADGPDAKIPGQVSLNWKWDMAGEITREGDRVWREDERSSIWAIPWITTEQIGTDPKLADNFIDNRYDASKLVPDSEPVNAGSGLQLLLNELIPDLYQQGQITTAQQVAAYDGLNVPFRIENKRAYTARPLHGVWATPPYLHNGSVPTIYDLLSPLRERPKQFYVGNREYDPERLGYQTQYSAGSFLHDTSIKGNQNIGHLFTDVNMPGRIGDVLSEEERFALLEYIKVMGNPAFDEALDGDPLNWDKYDSPPENESTLQACEKSRKQHAKDDFLNTLGMEITEQEKAAIEKAMQYGREISKAAEKINGLPYRRDAHAKATGCVRAYFSVNGDIAEHLQHSVFSEPGKEYQAWIRFSNGDMTVRPDDKPDARGMAIKIMGAEGKKIAPELPGEGTQDFIMTNTPAFFNRNVFDYVDDMYYLSKLERTRWFISFFPPRFHPKLLYRASQTVSAKINTPLEPQYYSMLPYQLGETRLKFSVKPCGGMEFNITEDKKDKDYLTEAMQHQLQSGAACFDFMVQEKRAGKNMPLDDASVIWSESDSPFVPIARVSIPPQTFTSEAQQTFCENISMNPWHGVGDWRPLGSLNKSRRLVYYAVSQYRHQQNDASLVEPTNWCFDNRQDCDPSQYFNTSKVEARPALIFDSQYH